MPADWSRGSTTEWRKIRKQVLDRDGWRCQVRLPGCGVIAKEAHHLYGNNSIHGDDPRYIVASCVRCNRKVGNPAGKDPAFTPNTVW